MPTVPAGTLFAFARELLQANGVPHDEAQDTALHLVNANTVGHDSHGLMRLPQYLQYLRDGKYKAGQHLKVIHETPAVLAADAGWGLGPFMAKQLLLRLIDKAKVLGVAAGSLRHCGHCGRLGEYAEIAAYEKLAFFGTVNAHGAGRRVAPPGGTEGRISTNPICFGVPTETEPVVLDFGTSVAAEGKVRVHFQKKEPAPAGWLINSAGEPTTDPSVLYADPRGTILPFGGPQAYKGFGLGLVLDMLAGGLSGGSCSNPDAPIAGIGNTVLFTLYDPALFGGTDHFIDEVTNLAGYVRGCPLSESADGITLPGDPERSVRAARQRGGIPIPDGTWELIAKEAERAGVEMPLPA